MFAIGVVSRHVRAMAMTSNTGPATAHTSKQLAADVGPMKEVRVDTDVEQPRSLQTFLHRKKESRPRLV